ncbi:XRE family transcriptional regulator [Salmonella enterica]|uniref:XRE family transcriptional regulator n=3 Tax=Salmonella enterica TaxID=28901 RepID=A0A5U3D2Q2_SALDZ|nr:transcriptional regulator [Salmonella enterica]EBP3413784.1 XRE family transcriptional regulator [Salmonella enterica subsp. diarizonae]ECG1719427.1 XRE family transcriptional regulator [Salmonella enterica subsp. diarizonae serovar 17:z10:e,n,x,z15]EDW0436295.1 XRE family transcriptional regulator [Salmonella enterica subsp. enterica serovar Lexington]EHQ9195588.1 XRE family transcriptional regulator [Salmonella enterica subsp. diarizonae serovar 50:k:z:[z50],[z57],[z68], [z86]]EAA7554963.
MQSNIGMRLREERERLGLSQPAMGEIGGVKKLTQLNYEKGERSPDAAYLCAISKFGADIQFIVTGVRSSVALNADEQELLSLFRKSPIAVKAAALAALTAGSSASGSVNVSGSGNRVAGRDYHEKKK